MRLHAFVFRDCYEQNCFKRGGADTPSNMQWQTKVAAKAKDKIE